MNPFNSFPKSALEIVAPDGSVRGRTEGIVSQGQITIFDTKIHLEPGDELRRSLPNGFDETHTVRDATYQEKFHAVPAHWDVKVIRKGAFPKGTGGHYIHVAGSNARVNLNSTDNSSNTVVHGSILGDLRTAIQTNVADPTEREALTEAVKRLEVADRTEDKLDAYQKLITAGANHMTILAPFLPALTALMS